MEQASFFCNLNDGRQIEIRSPQRDEASDILAVMTEIAETSPYILSTSEDFKKRTIEAQTKWIDEANRSSTSVIIAAYFKGKVVGLCDARSFKEVKRRHRASLGISVDEKFRATGLGRKMTEILLENMKKFEGIKIIQLEVMSANLPAIKLYESFGFKKAGIFPKAYILPSGEELDNISMYINL